MLQVHSLAFFIVLESAGVLLLVITVWMLLAMKRRSRNRKAVNELITLIKTSEADRKTKLREFLASTGLSEDALDEAVSRFNRQEMLLYKDFIHVFMKRDAAAVGRIQMAVDAHVQPYHELELTGASDLGVKVDERILALEEEKAEAEEELEITRQTMNNILNEYAQIFARGGEEAKDSMARKILSAGDAHSAPASAEASAQEVDEASNPKTDIAEEESPERDYEDLDDDIDMLIEGESSDEVADLDAGEEESTSERALAQADGASGANGSLDEIASELADVLEAVKDEEDSAANAA